MPDHQFEQLDDQRFQQFCQALLADSYRDLQCLPVAQPDGGRDALQRSGAGLLIFQVKYAREPRKLKSPEKWVNDVIEAERPKIESLVRHGAVRYKLITNLSATAHLDGGSLDRVQRRLQNLLPVPADCWWRDDLNRRLDKLFDLKLSYPELFTGNDFIRLLVERNHTTPDAERRQNTIKAYLADQYEREREVRFKQIELSNELLGVFVDVPAAPEVSEPPAWDSPGARLIETVTEIGARRRESRIDELRDPTAMAAAGAGSLLLDPRFQREAPRVVIEGAPGQGKSTMLQYVCQVHRLRLLDKSEVSQLAPGHATSPVRLPLKVDLRDLARWLTGRGPAPDDEVPAPLRTLEGFLSAQITAASGGANFDVGDLHASISESRVLLALDGLDEVVDITDRGLVIDAIAGGVKRLSPIASSLQVVVTSRPASFVGAASLPDDLFQQMRLQKLSRALIDDYAAKWMEARNLNTREREELTQILDVKLKQPHIRDLAHNPMQLAILLTLVHRRGKALPDQRTALYSSYMDAFLDREADKTEAVRNHRDLLMTLHGHIAWLLHCQAEKSGEGGRLTAKEIETIVEGFLTSKGHPPDLFGNLFAGVFDRVGALVSRVQSTYEFEVQPLREFFAARYLYQTAPHSSAGKVRVGTRPERFDAMVRHPYWLNVTRFYAGSYDIGELSSLADQLIQLRKDPIWGATPHPRMVSAQLLADWIFQQEVAVQGRIVAPLTSELEDRASLSDHHDPSTALRSPISLPAACGGTELAEEAVRLLRKECRWDRQVALSSVIRAQIPDVEDRLSHWFQGFRGLRGRQRDNWIRSTYNLGLSDVLSPAQIGDVASLSDSTIDAILYAELFDVFGSNDEQTRRAIDAILRRPGVGQVSAVESSHPLPVLAKCLLLDRTMHGPGVLERLTSATQNVDPQEGFASVHKFLSAVHGLLADDSADWPTSMAPWNSLVESGRTLFGDRPALFDLAIVAAGVSSRRDRGRGHADLFDSKLDLCHRARYARLRTGDAAWWRDTLEAATGENDQIFASALCWTWASESTLSDMLPLLTEVHRQLDGDAMDRLVGVIGRAHAFSRSKARELRDTSWLDGEDGPGILACIGNRLPNALAISGVEELELVSLKADSWAVLNWIWEFQLQILAQHPDRWDKHLELIADRYQSIGWTPDLGLGFRAQLPDNVNLPLEVAQRVVVESSRFPARLVAVAEAVCMVSAQADLVSVGETAERDGWFKPSGC